MGCGAFRREWWCFTWACPTSTSGSPGPGALSRFAPTQSRPRPSGTFHFLLLYLPLAGSSFLRCCRLPWFFIQKPIFNFISPNLCIASSPLWRCLDGEIITLTFRTKDQALIGSRQDGYSEWREGAWSWSGPDDARSSPVPMISDRGLPPGRSPITRGWAVMFAPALRTPGDSRISLSQGGPPSGLSVAPHWPPTSRGQSYRFVHTSILIESNIDRVIRLLQRSIGSPIL